MSAPQVLIVSNRSDAHVPLVERELARQGVAYFTLNTECFGGSAVGEFKLDAESSYSQFIAGNQVLSLAGLTAVWYRRPEPPAVAAHLSTEAKAFAEAELKAFLDGLLALPTCRWLSDPEQIRRAGHRLLQLGIARDLGFEVPPTLVSQRPEVIREFARTMRRPLVAKLVSKGPPRAATPESQYVVFTEMLDDAALENDAVLALCPAIYQPYIDKAYELRVTVVGGQVFACRIDSQASPRTRVDWRHYDLPHTPHLPYELPERQRSQCLALVDRLGLAFGAIDLIVTPDGNTCFLEINPNGQWGWIEELTGMPIAAAHAKFLVDGRAS